MSCGPPIMAWFTSTELLAAQDAALPPERRQRLLARSLRSGEQVLRLMESLLDATLIASQAPKLMPDALALTPLIRETVQSLESLLLGEVGHESTMLTERAIHLVLDGEVRVWADGLRVRQVLTNLLSNALKYSDPDSDITITTSVMRGDAAPAALIQIHDQGWGIPPGAVERIFDRFYRLERDTTSSVRGTGIGLALCRTLVEAMGGRIWVESAGVRGQGSTFAFTLPLIPSDQPARV